MELSLFLKSASSDMLLLNRSGTWENKLCTEIKNKTTNNNFFCFIITPCICIYTKSTFGFYVNMRKRTTDFCDHIYLQIQNLASLKIIFPINIISFYPFPQSNQICKKIQMGRILMRPDKKQPNPAFFPVYS